MKIELTDKEICVLFFCVKELANRCKESKYTVKYPQSNIKVYEDLAKKLEDSLKMKDDWTKDEYLEVKPILLYVKRKEPKEYYPIFIKRKDELKLTLKCDFFKIKIKNTRVTASEVALIVKPLLKSDHNVSNVFSVYAIKPYEANLCFVFSVFKSRTDKGYEYKLRVLENNHTFPIHGSCLETKEELSLDKAFVKLVKLNQLFGKEKVKILDVY